ncbi:hypothetical protein FQU75_00065 [Paenibacillus polymyxa]|nr:hypothetical protein FQU75_00065 [Paenibacillus polymyxa]
MSERTVDLIRADLQSAKHEAKKNILLPVREVEDLLALVDSLQQQVAQLQEMDRLHTSGAKQLVQDLHTLRVDRDKLQEALEQIQYHLHREQYMSAESVVDAALGE